MHPSVPELSGGMRSFMSQKLSQLDVHTVRAIKKAELFFQKLFLIITSIASIFREKKNAPIQPERLTATKEPLSL